MEPIPVDVRVLGILLAAIVSPLLVASVFAGTLRAAQINAEIHRTASYSVGTAPKLHVEAQFGHGNCFCHYFQTSFTAATLSYGCGSAACSSVRL